jgi:hypothetical protein
MRAALHPAEQWLALYSTERAQLSKEELDLQAALDERERSRLC